MHITIDLNNYTKTDSFYGRVAARAIICNKGRFLMIHGSLGDYKFPGGGVEKGEIITDALKREVKEETGYDVIDTSIMEYGVAEEKRAGITCDVMIMDSHYYICDVSYIYGRQRLVDYEIGMDYKACWISLEEAIAANKQISDIESCPWVVRDTKVMEYLLSENMGNM